jgi:GH25 family lysozyme M1 (1,4-beta-N-acetylmuramidase)
MKSYKAWIIIIIAEAILLIGILAGISMTRSHSKALPFEITQSLRQSFDTELETMAEDNYWQFVNQRFILVNDDDGVLQWVKIDNAYGRNDYQFEDALIEDDLFLYYTEDGEVSSSVGIDVSRFQGAIDWTQVKSSGVDFAFVRVGYRGYGNGQLVLDDTFDYNVAEALKNDLSVGVYFFSQATTYEEGVEEAQFVLNNVKAYNINLPIVLDTEDAMDEDARTAQLSPEERTRACLGFMETIRAAGYETMLYANLRWIALNLDISMLHGYDIWFAQYASEPRLPYNFKIWQYSQEGTVPGISQPVDLNIGFDFYGKY